MSGAVAFTVGVLCGCGYTETPPPCETTPGQLRGTFVLTHRDLPGGGPFVCNDVSCNFPPEQIGTLSLRPGSSVDFLTSDVNSWSPTWSPDGSHIAFASGGTANPSLEVMDRHGGSVAPIVGGDSPTWAPDGSRIAFGSSRGLESIRLDGSDRVLIHEAHGSFMPAPAWSPDGTRIAFVACAAEGACGLFTVSVSGGPLTRLTPDALSPDTKPSWSPDGSRLAFTGLSSEGVAGGIWVVSSDGSARARISETGSSPTWSPDGSLIAFLDGGIDVVSPDRRCAATQIFSAFADSLEWSAIE